ncbi:MAG: hypothetical protein J1E81_06155 [Eubacterium sp.]|nr:hypothetical protein [Eubacterium sp.]
MSDLKQQLFEIVKNAKERGNTVEVEIDDKGDLVFYEIERTVIGEYNFEVEE